MLVTDENISEIEVWRLHEQGIRVRQIAADLAEASVGDDAILPLLRRLKQPTFFPRDRDFWNPRLWHARYCLAFLDVADREGAVATAIRRFLRHSESNTHRKRAGKVVRVHPDGLHFWRSGQPPLLRATWP